MTAYDERDTFGSYLEEFHVGDTWKHWPGKTITEADNHIHSLLVMNHHPLHIDEEWNRAGQHGKILVNGTLVFSIVVGMSGRSLARQSPTWSTKPLSMTDLSTLATLSTPLQRSSISRHPDRRQVEGLCTRRPSPTIIVRSRFSAFAESFWCRDGRSRNY